MGKKSFLFKKKVGILPEDQAVPMDSYTPEPCVTIHMVQNGYKIRTPDGKEFIFNSLEEVIKDVGEIFESIEKKQK